MRVNQNKEPSWPWSEAWPWAVGVLVVTSFVLPWSLMEVGGCVDYVPGYGESFCESGPVIGRPAATIVGAMSALLILCFLYRMIGVLVRRRRMGRREAALKDLVALSQPLSDVRSSIAGSNRTGVRPVILTVRHVQHVLERYVAGDLDDASLEEWAETVRSLDDIRFDANDRDLIAQAIFELSTPELFGHLPAIVARLRLKLNSRRNGTTE